MGLIWRRARSVQKKLERDVKTESEVVNGISNDAEMLVGHLSPSSIIFVNGFQKWSQVQTTAGAQKSYRYRDYIYAYPDGSHVLVFDVQPQTHANITPQILTHEQVHTHSFTFCKELFVFP